MPMCSRGGRGRSLPLPERGQRPKGRQLQGNKTTTPMRKQRQGHTTHIATRCSTNDTPNNSTNNASGCNRLDYEGNVCNVVCLN
eukprot:234464-Pyramimonas_sp.AAC.1